MTQVNVVETVIKPLTCKTSDTEYVSEGIDKNPIGRCCQGLLKNLYTGRQNVWSGWPVYEENAYVPEGRNEGGRVATPTNFSIFDSYDMKSLRTT